MKKKTVFVTITPIPSHIPRQLAIDMLHSHQEIIELNPLVIGVKPIKAPQSAPPDEFFSTWYDITERIQYVPGMGRFGSGKINFNGCFHDMPWGLQTHVYAPMGIDLRNKWQIRGNQPGEPPETKELGSGAPPSGLYLREDIEIKCNPAMVSFVKKEMKAASKTMVDRLVKKAELIDAGVLSAMFDDGKLKTMNPADRSQTFQTTGHYSPGLLSPAPTSFGAPPQSPGFYPPSAHPNSAHPNYAQNQSAFAQNQSAYARQSQFGQYGHAPPPQGLAIEMPGSTHFAPDTKPPQQHLHPANNRFSSAVSELSASSPHNSHFQMNSSASDRQSYAGSVSSHPSSFQQGDDSNMTHSPGHDKRGFVAELPASFGPAPNRTPRSPNPNAPLNQQQTPPQPLPQDGQQYNYNPADYARMP